MLLRRAFNPSVLALYLSIEMFPELRPKNLVYGKPCGNLSNESKMQRYLIRKGEKGREEGVSFQKHTKYVHTYIHKIQGKENTKLDLKQ